MKKIILAALLAISTLTASAQADAGTFSIVPQVGVNFANTTGNADTKVGFLAGVEGVYQASDMWAISVGAFYANEGAKPKGADAKWNINNLNIPILANCYVASGLAVKLGVQPAINLSSKLEDVDMKELTKGFAVSIPVGLSYEFSNVVLDARYNIGVTDMFKTDIINQHIESAKNNTVQITIGYKF